MILALLAAATLAGPVVVETPIADAKVIQVQVLVRLPELDARELGVAQVLAGVLLEGTSDLTRTDLRNLSSLAGSPIRCTLMPDHFRIGFAVPKGDLALAGRIVAAVVREPLLPEEKVGALLEALPYRKRSYWAEALEPRVPRFDRVDRQAVVTFQRHVFRPENVTVGVGGAFAAGEAAKEMESRFAGWKPDAMRYPRFHMVALPKDMERRTRAITTAELTGPETALDADDFPAKLLATAAIGMGKSSTLFRAVREKAGLSYLQEAFLWPTLKGLQLRIVVAAIPGEGESELPEKVRRAVLADVEAWSESDLARAKTVLRAGTLGGDIPGPLWLRTDRPLGDGIEDATLLAAYTRMKTGKAMDAASLLALSDGVSLQQMKRAATDMVAGAKTRLISGR